jgi:hypothetical protein
MSHTAITERHPDLADPPLRAGSTVEVRLRFDRSWARGFTVADVGEPGIVLRRVSDGSLIPASFQPSEVRRAPVE